MKLRYNYKLTPNKRQLELLKQAGGTTRFLWNYFLRKNINEYATSKEYTGVSKFQFYHEMAASLPKLKEEYPWLKNTYSQVLQQVLKDLDQALKFKKNNRGFPKFKSKYSKRDSFGYIQHTKIEGKYLHVPKIGNIKIKLHRELPNYSSVTLYQNNNNWYASFVIKKQEQPKQPIEQVIGVDVNSSNFATSNNELITNPKFLKQRKDQVKCLQRKLSRKQKSSRNRIKANNQLSRITRAIRNRRHNFLHTISSGITKPGVLVCAETLKVDQMKKTNHLVAIAIQDAGWSNLVGLLKYKSELRGGYFHQINQWLASSKICNCCGFKKKKIDLSEREYRCDECGVVIHRDLNAALNIRDWGQQEFVLRYGDVFAGRQELPPTPLDVVLDVLSTDNDMSATTMKEEATSSLDS